MTNASATNLLKAYRLAVTKKEITIADLLEKIIISEIHRDDISICNHQQPSFTLPSIFA